MSGYKTTPERRANLVKLARFLYTEPFTGTRFGMEEYAATTTPDDEDADFLMPAQIHPDCGAVCCAIGCGPLAGIPVNDSLSWTDYYCTNLIDDSETSRSEWRWCFDTDWHKTDDTPKGAAKRILWLLLRGLPEKSESQRSGYCKLCYEYWEPTEADWQKAAVDA